MKPAGAWAEQLRIHHQRQPRKGLPISHVAGCKCPDDSAWGQAVGNVRIFANINLVIIVDKIEIADLPEDQQSTQYQSRINENNNVSFNKLSHISQCINTKKNRQSAKMGAISVPSCSYGISRNCCVWFRRIYLLIKLYSWSAFLVSSVFKISYS